MKDLIMILKISKLGFIIYMYEAHHKTQVKNETLFL